jgi:hypothetical protein
MSQLANAEGIDWYDSGVQVKLRLTSDPEILKARKRDLASWQTEKGGRNCLVLRDNTKEFRFYPGEELTVPAPIARGLISNSVCTVGDSPQFDPYRSSLDIVSHWVIGQKEPGNHKAVCPDCGDEFVTAKLLAGHIMSEHSDEPPASTPNMDAHLKGKKVPVNS